MKKKIVILVIALVCIYFFIFGGFTKEGKIGETYTWDGLEVSVNYVEFTDAMDNMGGANDNYWKPLPADANRNQLAQAVTPKNAEDTICVISFTVKNTSKDDYIVKNIGSLDYDKGYKYSDGGLSYRVSEKGVWSNLEGGLKLEKLRDKSYEFRAYMVVPKVLVTETNKPLTYTIFGRKFDLR